MVLEEIRILDGVSFNRANGDGGNDGSGVVCRIVVVAGELDGHARRIWLADIFMAVTVQVSYEATVVVQAGGPLVGWKAGWVKLVGIWFVVLLGGWVINGEGVGLG